MTATHAAMRVTMRCACGNRERIFVTRALNAGWLDRRYVCDDCAPVLDRSVWDEDLSELEALQSEPMAGALAEAL